MQKELLGTKDSQRELEERLSYNLESSLKTEEEMETKIKVRIFDSKKYLSI